MFGDGVRIGEGSQLRDELIRAGEKGEDREGWYVLYFETGILN